MVLLGCGGLLWRGRASDEPGRLGIGAALLITGVSGLLHVLRGAPAWGTDRADRARILRDAGGLLQGRRRVVRFARCWPGGEPAPNARRRPVVVGLLVMTDDLPGTALDGLALALVGAVRAVARATGRALRWIVTLHPDAVDDAVGRPSEPPVGLGRRLKPYDIEAADREWPDECGGGVPSPNAGPNASPNPSRPSRPEPPCGCPRPPVPAEQLAIDLGPGRRAGCVSDCPGGVGAQGGPGGHPGRGPATGRGGRKARCSRAPSPPTASRPAWWA